MRRQHRPKDVPTSQTPAPFDARLDGVAQCACRPPRFKRRLDGRWCRVWFADGHETLFPVKYGAGPCRGCGQVTSPETPPKPRAGASPAGATCGAGGCSSTPDDLPLTSDQSGSLQGTTAQVGGAE